MKINEQALKLLKESEMTGETLAEMLENLAEDFESGMGEFQFTMVFDKDNTASKGELLPEIIVRLKLKE